MDNPFIQILRKAEEKHWCLDPYCSTCGAGDFRSALEKIGGQSCDRLIDALVKINLDELASFKNWYDAVLIAIRDILRSQSHGIIEAWFKRADQNIRFFDGILYRLIRSMPEQDPLRKKWIKKAIAFSVQKRDFSLIESLILVLRERANEYEQLIDIAKGLAKNSNQMRRVLRNACKIETLP